MITTTIKALYGRMSSEREPYIRRAEECAKYTIPSLFPQRGSNGATIFHTPYQSVGSRGVNNLASKLMLALFPPNASFFRLSPGKKEKRELALNSVLKEKVEQALMRIEQRAITYAETHQYRVTLSEALKVLVVTGNSLLFLPPKEEGMKLYKLNSYCVKRDALGNVVQIVTLDKIAWVALPEDVRELIRTKGQQKKDEDIVDIYTYVYLKDDRYYSYQEVEDTKVPGSDQEFPKDKTPWIPLRMIKVDGESYGRSFVEEYLGDLRSLESLTKSTVELAAICANILYLVNPNGITRISKLAKAEAGGFVPGRVEDIQALQTNKTSDFQTAQVAAQSIEMRLSYAFMLNSAVQRNGERVTAEEIRYVASELEDTLGGVYSILSQELQLPLVRRLLVQLEASGDINPLPDGSVEPTITTGLEALGRGHDLNKLNQFTMFISQVPGAAERLNMETVILMEATALGLDTTNLVKTEEQVQQEQQQAMMAEMMKGATPNLAKGFADAQLQDNGGGTK